MSAKSKFTIKPFRSNVHMDDKAADNIWSVLKDAISEIHNQNASALSFEELYRNAYNLVLHKKGDALYKGVKTAVEEYLNDVGEHVAKATDDTLISEICEKWRYHNTTMVMIRDILMYMDRTYVVQFKKTPVFDMGLEVYRDKVARHGQVKDRLRTLLLERIASERNGEVIERDQMKSTLAMLVDLGVHSVQVYAQDFEEAFLRGTEDFYRQEALQVLDYISKNTCPVYMVKAELRLKEEKARAEAYLHHSTAAKLSRLLEREMIETHAKQLVKMPNSGCIQMFKDDKLDDLARMYKLFSRVPRTLDEVRNAMSDYIQESGEELVNDKQQFNKPSDFVRALLAMRDKYEAIVTIAFEKDQVFQKALRGAFESFINMNQKCARFLSMYVDDMLRSKLKGQHRDDQMEAQLDKVIVLFRYLQDKDIFENFYKKHLAKRLLSNKSSNDELERLMITKLKTECGYQFTSKLEDFRKETMDKYKAQQRGSKSGPELHVDVLTTGHWPTDQAQACNLPAAVQPCCEAFTKFYLKDHNGRRLTFQTSQATNVFLKHPARLGTAAIKARFAGKTGKESTTHELLVTTYQMCILMLFNERGSEPYTFQEIQEKTNIPLAELPRHLISLAAPKFRILIKDPKGKAIKPSDTFVFNEGFKSKLFRVRIPLVSMTRGSASGAAAATSAEASSVPAAVAEDRRHLIEAAIVRIMKTRNRVQHNNLIAEVTKQLSSRFHPTPQQIKKRIESLIEREYMEREKEERRMYQYIA